MSHLTTVRVLIALTASLTTLAATAAPPAPTAVSEPTLQITRAGSVPALKGAVPANFTGQVRVDMLHSPQAPWHASAAYVTFEPGARTVWHTHPVGQLLIVTAGVGLVQIEGQPAQTIRPGDTVWIPAGAKHWHGATATTAMTHIAITESQDGQNVKWLEPVSDAQYPH
jgi:quercetin dioxygenase-like cupin family protein